MRAPLVLAAALLSTCAAAACADDAAPVGPAAGNEGGAADWTIAIDTAAAPAGKLTTGLLGQYDLSGALFHYDQIPGLTALMKPAGMADWRIGVGRWENTTRLLPTLTDGSSCAADLTGFGPEAYAGDNATDLTVLGARDWFTDDGAPVTLAATQDDSRYQLAYVRSVIDVATAFGATPLVDIDHMPRAFATNRTPSRTRAKNPQACVFSWSNTVSNVRPADAYLASTPTTPPIFATAAVGLVKRVVEGSGTEKPRPALRWEFWNEPDLDYAWDTDFDDAPHSRFFTSAIATLLLLDAYRALPTSPKGLQFGFGSFAMADTAVSAIKGLDGASPPVPVDFFSFHSYSNDPLVIVDDIAKVVAARKASVHYQEKELALTEWGNDLSATPDPKTIDASLLVATVLALGATLGLERTYHAIFYDFYAGIPFGLVDHAGQPKPLHQAYTLVAQAIAGGADRLDDLNHADGRLDDGQGAVLVSRDPQGKIRVLLVNRETAARTVQVVLGGAATTPSRLLRFDDPAAVAKVETPTPGGLVTLSPRSIVLLEL